MLQPPRLSRALLKLFACASHTRTPRVWACVWALLISCALLAPSAFAQQVRLADNDEGVAISQIEFQVVQDTISAAELNARNVGWQPMRDSLQRTLRANETLWIRFQLTTTTLGAQTWYLMNRVPNIQHAQLHLQDNNTQVWQQSRVIGAWYPQAQRYNNSRFFNFPLPLTDAGSFTVLQEVRASNVVALPAVIKTQASFTAYVFNELIVFGCFFGALIVMLLYNSSLYSILRDKAYLFYSVYVFSVVLYQLSVTGIGASYFGNSLFWLDPRTYYFFAGVVFLVGTLFTREFLQLPRWGGWLLFGNNALLIGWTLICVGTLITQHNIWLRLFDLAGLITCIVAVTTAAVLWRRNETVAKIYLIAWLPPIVGTIVFGMAVYGALPFNAFTVHMQMAGLVIEMVLLAYALAYRINQDRAIREIAQHEAFDLTKRVSEERHERLRAQMETLAVQRRLTDNLEQQVQTRTAQLEDAMGKLEKANADLVKLTVTDPLTTVNNRRYFDDTLIDEYKRAHRGSQFIAIIMVDIDHFKRINDNYGHAVGDTCIQRVARALNEVVNRPGDIVARYGGEEFVFLLPGSNAENAAKVAEAARLAVERIDVRQGTKAIPLSVSAGVAAWVPATDDGYRELMKAADAALYQAKNDGRNRVKTSERTHQPKKSEIYSRLQ